MSKTRLLIALVAGIAVFQWLGGRNESGMGSDEAVVVTPGNMESVLFTSSAPVLAYFWAPW